MNNTNRPASLLVVEDHPVFRKFLLSWLSRTYKVTAVRDGFEALRWLQAGNHVDAIVLDMEMPRIDGYRFLENIRYSGLHSKLPVIALTANSVESVQQRCEGLALHAVFSKPYNPNALREAIDSAAVTPAVAIAA